MVFSASFVKYADTHVKVYNTIEQSEQLCHSFFRLILLGDFSENMWCKRFCNVVSDIFICLRKIIMSLITKVFNKVSVSMRSLVLGW